jgi:proteasome lid subunit RPN8/RPN11
MVIRLKSQHLDAIRTQGESTYPFECCGLLLGQVRDGEKRVFETYAVINAKEEGTQHNRFLISPQALLEAERYARGKQLDILGFYHSHPDAEARPSQFDLDHAWPFYSYLIVSVKEKKAGEVTAWRMAEDRSQFDAEMMITI